MDKIRVLNKDWSISMVAAVIMSVRIRGWCRIWVRVRIRVTVRGRCRIVCQ